MKKIFWLFIVSATAYGYYLIGETLTTASLPTHDKPIEFYATETHHDLQITFTQAINEAKETIHLTIYSLRDKKVIKALQNAANRGVHIQIVCDRNASSGVARKLGSKIDTTYRKGRGLMHQKILITDALKVMIGSANLTTASLKMHGNLVSGFYSVPLAEYLINKFYALSREGFVEKIPHDKFVINGQELEMWLFPDDKGGVNRVRQLIRSAKKSIKVAMFTWTRFDLADEIIAAHNRGVQTEIALDRNASQGVSEKIAIKFFEAGIPIRVNQGEGLLHHKFMLVDDKTLLNGSANWTKAAFKYNDDCFYILSPLEPSQQSFMKKLWKEISLESTEYESN
jgi:phosphatidylserine/phosphatidylglycerophosphate/cardiolipin synthase-like enzyme